MPLTRFQEEYHFSEFDSVRFNMTEDGNTRIPCRVSYEALQDLASQEQFEGSAEEVFNEYRRLIEQVASDIYDSDGPRDAEGRILVTSEALTRAARS